MDIPKLIAKEICGELTPEERMRLDAWLAEREENRQLHERIRSRRKREERRAVIHRLHPGRQWQRVTEATGGERRLGAKRWMRYAAAVAVPLAVGAWGFFALTRGVEEAPLAVREATVITPGKAQAELVLAGGERIALASGGQAELGSEEGVSVRQEDACISYAEVARTERTVYHELKVPRGGEFRLQLPDGTMVYLNSETSLRYPVRFGEEERRVSLSGEAYFEVVRDTGRPFVVEMSRCAVEVLGTSFNARSYGDESDDRTTLVSGKVRLQNASGKRLELAPGEQGIVCGKTMEKRETDIYLHTAWKDGMFVFRKQPLEEIMHIVERWYNVQVVFEDEACRRTSLSGTMKRYEDFNRLTEILSRTGSTDFRTEGRVIYIRRKD